MKRQSPLIHGPHSSILADSDNPRNRHGHVSHWLCPLQYIKIKQNNHVWVRTRLTLLSCTHIAGELWVEHVVGPRWGDGGRRQVANLMENSPTCAHVAKDWSQKNKSEKTRCFCLSVQLANGEWPALALSFHYWWVPLDTRLGTL